MFECPVKLGVVLVEFPLNETANLNNEEDIKNIVIVLNGVQYNYNEQLSQPISNLKLG